MSNRATLSGCALENVTRSRELYITTCFTGNQGLVRRRSPGGRVQAGMHPALTRRIARSDQREREAVRDACHGTECPWSVGWTIRRRCELAESSRSGPGRGRAADQGRTPAASATPSWTRSRVGRPRRACRSSWAIRSSGGSRRWARGRAASGLAIGSASPGSSPRAGNATSAGGAKRTSATSSGRPAATPTAAMPSS